PTSTLFPYTTLFRSDDTYDQPNIEQAKKYLAEAGYDGEPVRLLTTRDDLYQHKGSVVLQEQLRAIGMKVSLRSVEWATYGSLAKNPDSFDVVSAGITSVSDPTQLSYLGADWTFAESPEVRKDLQEIKEAPSPEDARKIWSRTQEFLHDDYIPILMGGEFRGVAATRNNVEGFTA